MDGWMDGSINRSTLSLPSLSPLSPLSRRQQYYEGGVSSVYLWDNNDDSSSSGSSSAGDALPSRFSGCFLIKKEAADSVWDAIHVVDVDKASSPKSTQLSLTTTIMLALDSDADALSLSGSLTRQAQSTAAAGDTPLAAIGAMIEDMETQMRSSLDKVYFGKTREVLSKLKKETEAPAKNKRQGGQASIISELMQRQRVSE